MQAKTLVDSGATTNFIDRSFVERNHLVMDKLAELYKVINADGTPNIAGEIREYVHAYIEVGSHKTRQYLFVTQLGDKDMMLGYSYLYQHNPEIDWESGEWVFTRCPETCASRACKIRVDEAGADELHLEPDLLWESLLDNLGEEDTENPYINWIDMHNSEEKTQAAVIASMLDEQDVDEELDQEDEDTTKWKSLVPTWLYDYGDIFSKRESERMPERKAYDHPIDFVEGTSLPKPAKIYPLSLNERNSLDEWIDEELRKGYIQPSQSPIAAPFFFVKKHDGSL